MVPGLLFLSFENTIAWVTAVLVSEATRAYFDFFWAERRFGMAMAARMPMIATTINSSIRVKPLDFFRSIFSMGHPPFGFGCVSSSRFRVSSVEILGQPKRGAEPMPASRFCFDQASTNANCLERKVYIHEWRVDARSVFH